MKIKGLNKVLVLVNNARKVLDLKPLDDLPNGERLDGRKCPIANALEKCKRADTDYIEFDDEMTAERISDIWNVGMIKERYFGKYKVSTPSDIAFFIDDFDNEAYPEYEKEIIYEGEI